jgi:HSP20 family protein
MSNNNLVALVNDFFDDEFARFALSPVTSSRTFSGPALNIKEYDDHYKAIMKAPGLNIKDLKISIQNQILNIVYEEDTKDVEEDKGSYLRREWSHHYSFTRSLMLPKDVNSENVDAEYDNGILTVTIQKTPQAQPKHVDIKIKNKKEHVESKASKE